MDADLSKLPPWVQEGVALCRQGRWHEGVARLGPAMDAQERPSGPIPSLAFSYLGYGIARCQGRRREGLTLCEHAVRLEFYQPENLLNLARTYLLLGDRRKALAASDRGLKVDPTHPGLQAFRLELGTRRSPVLNFLSRSSLLNRILGRVRHALSRSGRA